MSFRDNLQHVRATRNMTQEQLAMLLGVSSQSVSKWEAERAYPEMDKLLKLCDLFGCTIDELVTGDLTARPADGAASMPSAKAPQDVTGYDQIMCGFAWKFPFGISLALFGISVGMLLSALVVLPGIESWSYAGIMTFVGCACGLAFVLPALFARSGFRKAHPFVENFYTVEQKDRARAALLKGLIAGVGSILVGFASIVVLQGNVWFASSSFFLFAAFGVFAIVRGCLLSSRCDIEAYNLKTLSSLDEAQIDALDDEALRARARQIKRAKAIYGSVMCVATAVGLVLLFVPVLGARQWFWLVWPIGGLICLAIRAVRSARGSK